MKFTVVTLFPQLIEAFVAEGLLGQARGKGLVTVDVLNPRKFTSDVHQTVDDRAFGGGDGMVMKPEPLAAAVAELRAAGPCRVVVLSPQGRVWNQNEAREWASASDGHYVLVCGRYAGIDQRFTVRHADDEISLGDFILNGGEVAACAVIESVARLMPGALGNAVSAEHDSFSGGLLEAPQFTRPREYEGLKVPAPLVSGNHSKITEFNRAVSQLRTQLLRPDLWTGPVANKEKLLSLVEVLEDDELLSLGFTREDLQRLREEWL